MNPTRRNLLKAPRLLAAYPFLASSAGFAAERESGARASELESRLVKAFDDLWIADSHEHIFDEADRTSRDIDFFDLLSHYTLGDLGSAGLSREGVALAMNKQAPDARRWGAVEEYWRYARFTGYAQNLRLAIRDIYGIDEISAATVSKINAAIREKNKPGLYRDVLKTRAHIRFYVQDDRHTHPSKPDREFFVIAREFDNFVVPQSREQIAKLEELTNTSITTLATLEAALEVRFNEALQAEMSAVKTLLAYTREIYFAEVERSAAEADFARMMQNDKAPAWNYRQLTERPFRNLEDYMFHRVMRLANAHRVPVQVHTGLNNNAPGERNYITNSNPTHLTNLFFLYPETKFDLFHIGYPYLGEMSALAKCFANVHVDFCWAHIISPTASARALAEYLDTIPSNKILAFGGDFLYAELTYAHAKIARRVCARVLAAKVEEGFCNEEEALEIGKRIFFENAARLFYPGALQQGLL
jgi:predicted TIM-barrel fold metal-dependent hydrolase